ncbi:hypothetical protein M758_8G141300 [Ceratodon purpureus]|nr:hypothetical protein M758_8G141300 [Ceratodon purpureus]
MEEGMDPRRGPPLMGGNRWGSGDIYHLGSSSGDGGVHNMNTRIRFEESGESSTGLRMGHHESGKGPESSRPPVRKPSQVPPKLVAARSSGGRRVQRQHQGPIQGQWNVLHGFADGLNEGGSETMGMEGDGNLGMGLSTHLGLSEEIIVHPAHVHSLSNSEFLGRGGRAGGNTLDFLSGRSPMQANSVPDYFGGRTGGHEGENMNLRMGTSGLPPIGSRGVGGSGCVGYPGSRNGLEERALDGGGNLGFSSLFMDRQDFPGGGRSGMSELRDEVGAGSMMSESLFMDRGGYRDDVQLHNSNNGFMGGAEAFLPSGSRGHGPSEEGAGCGSEGRHYGAERQSPFSMGGSSPLESSSGSHGHVGSSSRSSACKRKSCGPVAPGNVCSRSGSPHRSGYRDGYNGRGGGSNGMSRRTTGIGSSSSSPEGLGSSSSPSDAVFLGRYAEAPAMASGMEDPVPRRLNFGREASESSPDSVREGRYGKSVAGSSSGIPNSQRTSRGGSNGVVSNNGGVNHTPPFPRTVRRAMPSHDNLPRRTAVADSLMDDDDDDLGLSRSSLLEQMLSTSQSSVLPGGRVGGSGSPRRSEGGFGTSSAGDRAMQRYLGNSGRGLSSSGSQLGGAAGLESRLRSRVLSHHSELMSQSSGPGSHPVSLTMHTGLHGGGGPSTPSPSRPPPHPPSLRGRLQGSSLQSLLPPPSPSGPAPSRLPPSPPSRLPPNPSSMNPLSFAPSIDSLPSPASLFRGSLMHGSSGGGLRDRGFMSAAESLLGMPFRGLQMSTGDGGSQPRLVAEGLAEILMALERVERDEDLTYEQLLMLEATLLFGGMGLHDQHSDMRLDVDNMSYEELLALEERIGNVSTGLTSDAIAQKLKRTRYSSLDAVVARYSQECDIKCSICQEEYEEGDELGKIECGHGYHSQCIQQWLEQKNQCPICKAAAFS